MILNPDEVSKLKVDPRDDKSFIADFDIPNARLRVEEDPNNFRAKGQCEGSDVTL